MRTLTLLLATFVISYSAFAQEKHELTLEEKIAVAEKEEAETKAALDKAEEKYRQARKTRSPDAPPPHDPFIERADWLDASRRLDRLKIRKMLLDFDKSEQEHRARLQKIDREIEKTRTETCLEAEKLLADPKLTSEMKGLVRSLSESMCGKK